MSAQAGRKAALRTQLLARRAAQPPSATAAQAVCDRLGTVPALVSASIILGYAATPREVSIDAALQRWLDDGRTVCLPWVNGAQLGVAAVPDLDTAVAPGWRDVREPLPPRTPIAPQRLDALIVPGLGFDRFGNRLGYGGGHFDRLLAAVRSDAVIVGVGLDEQLVDLIPTEQHDRRVDVIVTPSRTVPCR